jgi:hypothetical protein
MNLEIADSCNQIKPQTKSLSTISISVGDDVETFDETNNIFVYYAVGRDLAIKAFFFCCEFLIASAFDGMNGVSVDLLDPQVTCIRFKDGRWFGSDTRFFK